MICARLSELGSCIKTFLNEKFKNGKDAINGFAEGDEQRMMLLGLKRFTKTEPFNTKDARRNIAAVLIEANKYCF